jgi:hypothetical protein
MLGDSDKELGEHIQRTRQLEHWSSYLLPAAAHLGFPYMHFSRTQQRRWLTEDFQPSLISQTKNIGLELQNRMQMCGWYTTSFWSSQELKIHSPSTELLRTRWWIDTSLLVNKPVLLLINVKVSKAFKKEVTENMGTENMTKLCTGRCCRYLRQCH